MLQIYFDLYRHEGQRFEKDLSQFTNDKEINRYCTEAGGKNYVYSCINLYQLLNQLSEDVKKKLFTLPLRVVKENLLSIVSKLSVENVSQWCDDLGAYAQHQFEEKGKKILTPNIVKKLASKFLPSTEPSKSSLKLHEPVFEEDFKVVQKIKKYGFTPEILEQFKAEVRAGIEGEIFTESLFPFLKQRNLNPLLILSPNDRIRWEFEQKLEEKDKEIEQKLEEKDKEIEQVRSHLELKIEQRDQRITELQQQNQSQQTEIEELKQQNQQILEEMKEFRQFMETSKAAA
ncbi:hypothetical protein [Crocosphaera chwakensis]|uniref:Uncharacterized protein n=1 Tax=Crocosphaera chwakensis CCY0110 TaxID=391612 RepID=A3IYU7_9CHRO|nr:hypothetical protein [Crocosphaera chwakensis]EAZ88358.1 hypothetical protein CY0110_31100 [Crocosphaera chwakensis CCY0110]